MSSGKNHLALRLSNLRKTYGEHLVLDGIELEVEHGAIHGLVGLNGSGKTSTLDCILGLQRFDSGEVDVLGFSPDRLNRACGRVVSVFDSPCLNPNLTVRQTLTIGAMLCGAKTDSIKKFEALLGIEQFSTYKIRHLSLGNKRRTSIAQALLGQPDLVLLDEPFNGLDAGGVDDVLELVKSLNENQGTTFLLSSHQLPYLEQICTHLSVLHQGKIAASNSVEELLKNRRATAMIHSTNTQAAFEFLTQTSGIGEVRNERTGVISAELESLSSAELNRLLVERHIPVDQLTLEKATLAGLFKQVTSGDAQ
ncbi:MAG: ABC transporter ATP-binding protein [Pseudohongiellaceae bacterium]